MTGQVQEDETPGGESALRKEIADLRFFVKVLAVVCFVLLLLPDLALELLLAPALHRLYETLLDDVRMPGIAVWAHQWHLAFLLLDFGLLAALLLLLAKAKGHARAVGVGVVIGGMAAKLSVLLLALLLLLLNIAQTLGDT